MTNNIYALLVGIDEYDSNSVTSIPPLKGCVNDITAMEQYLKQRVTQEGYTLHLKTLKNQEATRAAIIHEFRNDLRQAKSSDTVLFYFSGHGSQEQAPEEFVDIGLNRLNETLVCYDSRTNEGWDLADKELAKLISELSENQPHISIILDCCHSGSGTRDTLQETGVRLASTDKRNRPPEEFIVKLEELKTLFNSSNKEHYSTGLKIPRGRHVLLSACQATQKAKEIDRDGQTRGAFSYYLLDTLHQAKGNLTYRDLLGRAKALVSSQVIEQSPQLELNSSNDENQLFLNGAIAEREPYFIVSHNEKYGWVIEGGAVHGIQLPSREETTSLALFTFDSHTEDLRHSSKSIGTAKVTQVLSSVSKIEISGVENLATDQTFKAVITSLPLPPLGVYLEGDEEGVNLARNAIQHRTPDDNPSAYVREEQNKDSKDIRYRLLCRKNQYVIARLQDDRPLVNQIDGYTQENAQKAIQCLEHIARWNVIAELGSSGNGLIQLHDVQMEFHFRNQKYNELFLQSKDVRLEYKEIDGNRYDHAFKIKLINKSDKTLYCALLDLAELFDISSYDFFEAGSVKLEPGQEAWANKNVFLKTEVPDSLWKQRITEYTDIFKLIVSTSEFDARLLNQAELDPSRTNDADRGIDRGLIHKSTLNRLMNRVYDRAAKSETPAEYLEDWITTQVTITTIRPLDKTPISDINPNDLGSGIRLQPHPSLKANTRLTSVSQASRNLGNIILPPILREDSQITQTVEFTNSRGTDPRLSVLELTDVENPESVTKENPLRLLADISLKESEHLLPITYDGDFFLPLGRAKRTQEGGTEIQLERLPNPYSTDRSVQGSIWICFVKVVSEKLGRKSENYYLKAVKVAENQTVTLVEDIPAQVKTATNILLYVHGILGDTKDMVKSVQRAKATIDGQQRSLNECYDLILTFDYENINTSISEIARILKAELVKVGLTANHGKTLQIVAHSMGGLVSRWFIEREEGNQIVQHLVMLGTPNAGSPWPTVQDLATLALGIGLNSLSSVAWPVKILGCLVSAIEAVDVTLDEMKPNSDFLKNLAASPNPGIPYSVIAGNTSIIRAAMEQEGKQASKLKRLIQKLGTQVVEFPFLGQPNDIAVEVNSIKKLPEGREIILNKEVACDHLTYFVDNSEGLKALSEALAPKKKIEQYISTALKEDVVIHISEQKDSLPSQPPSVPELNSTSQEQLTPTQQRSLVSSTSKSSDEFENSFAIVVGINNYEKKPLETAVNDAEKICEILKDRYGYKVQLLTNEQATKEKLEEVFEDLKKNQITVDDKKENITNKDRLFFYFAGHGIGKDPYDDRKELAGFLIPQNAVIDNTITYITMQECHDALINLECRHMLAILDCCFAGSFRWASLTRKATPENVTLYKQRYDRFIKDPAWQVITSAAQDQTASDLLGQRGQKDDGKHSPFAAALLGVLKGQIEEQKRKNVFSSDIITATKLYSYLRDEVEPPSEELYERQTPEIWHLKKHGKGEYIFLLPGFELNKLENAPALNAENNPYRGLESYEEEHSHLFFGRNRQIKMLYEKVDQNALTVVVGAPGTGKSSLVKAGLIPNWRTEQLEYLKKQLKLEELQDQEEQLENLKDRIKYLNTQKNNLEDLNKQEEDLKEQLVKANTSQKLIDWQEKLKIESSQYLTDLIGFIKPLQETEKSIKEINQKQKDTKKINNQLEEAKTSKQLASIQKKIRIESSQFLQILEDLKEIEKQIELQNDSELEVKLEENKLNAKNQLELKLNENSKNLADQLKNLQEQSRKQLKELQKQLETQLYDSKKQWYIKVRIGESPIKALNDSLDQILRFTTPKQTYEQQEEDKTPWLNKIFKRLNLLLFGESNTSDSINSFQKENKELDHKLFEWKNHSLKWLGDKRLLVIDQFEELITLCKDEKERENFIKWLIQTINQNSEWLRIVLTVRSDFEPQFQDSALKQYWTEAKFADLEITRSELQKAIEEPATVKAINFELDKDHNYLVDKLLDEVGRTQGALPLVSLILDELYNKLSEKNDYESRTLTLEDYEELGGVTEVLTKKLESEYEMFVHPDRSDELFHEVCVGFQNLCEQCEHLQKIFAGFYLLAEWQEAQAIVEGKVVKFRNDLEELPTTDTTLSNEQNLVKDSQRIITFYFLGEWQEEQAIGEVKEIKSLSVDREELSTSATIPITDETSLISQQKLSVTCLLPHLAGKFHYLILISPLLSQYLDLENSFHKFEKSCQNYEEFRKLYEQHKESYQKWDKTIQNVMLRMVAVDSQLARRPVLRSELEYSHPEENKRVNEVIEAFVKARLLVQEQNIVEPVHDVVVLKWGRLITWKKDADENVPLSLRRRLKHDTEDWQENEKEQKYLWDKDHRLVLLEKVSNSNDNWLNKLEDEFVKESLKKRQIQKDEELSEDIESLSITRKAAISSKAEQEYKNFINSEQLDRDLQSLREKTIRNVMLRMVVVDGVELARRRVLKSELVYPKPEENERVNQVVEAFISADLLLRTSQGEKIYVEPNCDLVQAWDRLRIWTQNQKEHLILLRWLTPEAVSWQDNNKEPSFLWSRNRHLDSLEQVVKSDDNWLNQLENEFVNKSIDKKRSDLTKSRILRGSSLILPVTLFFGIFSSIQKSSNNQNLVVNVSPISTPSSTPQFERDREISSGEKILTTPDQLTWLKQAGVQASATNNFDKAVKYLKEYRDKQSNDPEALIYLNNAMIGNHKSYMIATSVPVSSDINSALEMLRGVAQAQDEINKKGGINGILLKVLIADDNDDKDIAKKLVKNSDVLGVVEHFSRDVTLEAEKIYHAGKLVAISPISASTKLTGSSNYIFCTAPNDSKVAKSLVGYMRSKLGKKNAAVLYNSKSASSESLKSEFEKFLSKEGGQVSSVFDLSAPNFKANKSIEESINTGAEVLVLLPNTGKLDDTLQVVKANKANKKQLPLLGGEDVYTPKVLEEGKDYAVGMVIAVPWHILVPHNNYNFPQDSRKLWKADVNWRTAMSYNATVALIEGLKKTSTPPTREGLAQILGSPDFTAMGATGEVKFDAKGDRNQGIQLVEIKPNTKSRSKSGYDFVPIP
ncbi:nSTAND1 domain-containing NTPase [Nostoc sp. 'Lobaria pulmonaria (5183) cyanobiont']|uniref:nSTAND1 domain-containing NTPase n=1 Tax=Nostoc sp. 'Lobaria pulmonaria (5183) cyanobiont' TaxID=1618022 RepID=UPI000CF32D87|nr:caspase family protein [Nostoc sp. 'Lobaria pulmonaria (5183) cyanobiont']AVH74355.1 caspase domain-containing protein [Nostoc sp. 'Lobaria pulmonaria (5183) cyanobiont']